MIEIGTLVRLKFKTVRHSQYQLVSELIENEEDRTVGLVIAHHKTGQISVRWINGNAEIGHPTGSVGSFWNMKVEVIG